MDKNRVQARETRVLCQQLFFCCTGLGIRDAHALSLSEYAEFGFIEGQQKN